jgi:paraquat-inducible protein A
LFEAMKILSYLIVCPHCDAVYRRPLLELDQVAQCAECSVVLCRSVRLSIDAWFALTLTSAIAFLLANVFPVISVGLQGFHNEATLWQFTRSLVQGIGAPMAVVAIMVTVGAPFFQIVLLSWILAFARKGRRAPGFASGMKCLSALRPWSMVEVALLGVLVTAIKLSSMAQVSFGLGLWAMAIMVCLAALTINGNLQWLWQATDPAPKEARVS